MQDILRQLEVVLHQRKTESADSSYVAALYAGGLNKILEKVGEESTEVILAAKDATPDQQADLVSETADLWFHTLVMLAQQNVPVSAVTDELSRRFGLSGLEEKASRSKPENTQERDA